MDLGQVSAEALKDLKLFSPGIHLFQVLGGETLGGLPGDKLTEDSLCCCRRKVSHLGMVKRYHRSPCMAGWGRLLG
jgi:hypothetical protein